MTGVQLQSTFLLHIESGLIFLAWKLLVWNPEKKNSPEQYHMLLLSLSLLGLKGLLSKQWTGKGFDRDLGQLLDLLYLEQYNGKGEMQVLKFNETFVFEILVTCDLYVFRMDLLYHFVDAFQSLCYFSHYNNRFLNFLNFFFLSIIFEDIKKLSNG